MSLEAVDQFVRLSYRAGRGDAGWWLVGAMLKSAGELRKTLPIPRSAWDQDYAKTLQAYHASGGGDGPTAVLLSSQARSLLQSAIQQSPTATPDYVSALLDNWMASIQRSAPGMSVEPLRKVKEGIPTWVWATAGTIALGFGLKWLFGGAEEEPEEQQAIVVFQANS